MKVEWMALRDLFVFAREGREKSSEFEITHSDPSVFTVGVLVFLQELNFGNFSTGVQSAFLHVTKLFF